MKAAYQTTLRRRVTIGGVGVHSAAPAQVVLHPAEPGSGVAFLRTGLPGGRVTKRLSGWALVGPGRICADHDHRQPGQSILGVLSFGLGLNPVCKPVRVPHGLTVGKVLRNETI